MKDRTERAYRFETLQLHVGQEQADPATDARAVPIYQTSSYVFHDCEDAAARFALSAGGNIYGRLTNPTEEVFEKRMAALEGGSAALAVASGAAAIAYTFQNLAHQGDHIVAAKNIYGGTYNFLAHTFPDSGVTTTFVDPFNFKELEGAIQENTKAVFVETLGNPNSDVVDLEAIAAIAHAHGIVLAVDNTFATPYLVPQRLPIPSRIWPIRAITLSRRKTYTAGPIISLPTPSPIPESLRPSWIPSISKNWKAPFRKIQRLSL